MFSGVLLGFAFELEVLPLAELENVEDEDDLSLDEAVDEKLVDP